ncbi:MAG: DedA family protein [Patescibacteria group bacterium]
MLEFQNLADSQLPEYISAIGYPAMLLVMTIEGPIATIVSSFLASLGVFNIFAVFALSVLGDVLGDIACYGIGFWGGKAILEKARKKLHVKSKILEKIEALFLHHGFKTIFAVKSTTGLCWITFIAAGAFRMDFRRFLTASLLGGLVWSSFLALSGYFFGYAFLEISRYIRFAGFFVIALAVLLYFLINLYKKHQAKKIVE